MKNIILAIVLALVSTGAWGLTTQVIADECKSMEGNQFAIEKFSDSHNGEQFDFVATVVSIKAINDGLAVVTVESRENAVLISNISGESAAELRVNVEYQFSARFKEMHLHTTDMILKDTINGLVHYSKEEIVKCQWASLENLTYRKPE